MSRRTAGREASGRQIRGLRGRRESAGGPRLAPAWSQRRWGGRGLPDASGPHCTEANGSAEQMQLAVRDARLGPASLWPALRVPRSPPPSPSFLSPSCLTL